MVVHAGNWNTVIPGLGELRREVIDCWSQPELLQILSQKNERFWKRELQWISIGKFRTSRETDTVTYTVYSFTRLYPHTHLWHAHMLTHTHTFIYSNASFTDIILCTLIYSTRNYTYSHCTHCTDKHTEIHTPRTTWLPTHTTYTHTHSKLFCWAGWEADITSEAMTVSDCDAPFPSKSRLTPEPPSLQAAPTTWLLTWHATLLIHGSSFLNLEILRKYMKHRRIHIAKCGLLL